MANTGVCKPCLGAGAQGARLDVGGQGSLHSRLHGLHQEGERRVGVVPADDWARLRPRPPLVRSLQNMSWASARGQRIRSALRQDRDARSRIPSAAPGSTCSTASTAPMRRSTVVRHSCSAGATCNRREARGAGSAENVTRCAPFERGVLRGSAATGSGGVVTPIVASPPLQTLFRAPTRQN